MTLKYFDAEREFLCQCGRPDCDAPKAPHRLLGLHLDRAREMLGEAIVVTRGNTCARHNEEVGGEKNSEHVIAEGCLGADLRCKGSRPRWQLVDALRLAGFTRIGFYAIDGHVHAGVGEIVDPVKWPPNVIWVRP